ncbi:ISKra4 family transposase, partial [Lamprobacter modestohalophilus]|nr:ISKra4 family transposase [Lamprobacter modestohalophilus]
ERYVYQTSRGGRIYCPLEHQARIIRGATPRFASQLSHKYAQLNVSAVQTDLEQNHGRKVARSYIQNVADWVGSIATAKEETWEYALPALQVSIATVVISLDGAMIPMADSAGYREAMAGALSFYDHDGERQHTVYLAAAPEYGKQTFLARLEREIARAKQQYPNALYLGIADGAHGNWTFLEQHTQRQLIDFFHATE